MLDIIEVKLMGIRDIAKLAKQGNLNSGELEELNARLHNLVAQIRALDEESKKKEDGKILE